MARALTMALALGFQGFRLPSPPKAATRLRVCTALPSQQVLASLVQTEVKLPPAYTVLPLTARAETELPTSGFQAVAVPVAASTAASRLRVRLPLIELAPLNKPPRYAVLPLTARALTVPLALGSQGFRLPSPPKAATRLRVCAALRFQQVLAALLQTVVKLPPP